LYEHHRKPPISNAAFLVRMLRHFAIASLLMVASLAAGMAGYEHYEHLPWRDAFVNAAMLLGGMGPVNPLRTDDGKVFAGLYALYAGIVFLIIGATLLTPLIHRVLHRFHWESQGSSG
jgi:hypothetical protein